MPLTPNNLRFVDLGLRAMHGTSLSDADKLAMIMLVSSYSRSAARIQRELRGARQDPGSRDVSGAAYAEVFSELVTPERFPYLHPVVASGVYLNEDDDVDDVVFGLERVLDGIGSTSTARPPSARRPRCPRPRIVRPPRPTPATPRSRRRRRLAARPRRPCGRPRSVSGRAQARA
ncbi:TetR/AcrR family transcriptional regulator C-terminal domain-containing protein [Oerskovia sp. M15]